MLRASVLLLFFTFNLHLRAQSLLTGSGIELYNYYLVNPAFIASDSLVNIDAIYYEQWTNFEGSPKEINVAGNIPFFKLNSGVLLKYNRSVLGNLITNSYGLGYTYHYHINNIVLKAGISSAFNELSLAGKWLAPDGSGDHYIPDLDMKRYYLNNCYGFGFTYKGVKGGLSLIDHMIELGEDEVYNTGSSIYSFISYNYKAVSWLQLNPMISWYTENKVELSIISTLFQNYRLGISYRIGERRDLIFGSRKETLFSLSAGATILKHAYINVVVNPNYYPMKLENWGYTLLAQIGCRF